MKKRTWIIIGIVAILAFVVIGAVSNRSGASAQSESSSQIAQVTRATLSSVVESSGSIAAEDDAALVFGTSGTVASVNVEVGSLVKKGDVLAKLDTSKLELQVDQAEQAYLLQQATYSKTVEVDPQVVAAAQAALDKAESDYRAAQARVTALLAGAGVAATERSFATIVAPYSGVVSARYVELGEMATPGKPLMTGFDPSTLRVVATVPQAEVAAIQAGAKARVEVPSSGMWIDVRNIVVVPSADPRTHTTRIRLELPEDVRGVYPGVYARAHFVTGSALKLLVPRSAVVHRSEVTGVYVVDDKGDARLRQVRLGEASDEHYVEVLAGVRPGERVALDPVRAGMADNAAARP